MVTANKALLARHGVASAAIAEKKPRRAQFRGRGRRRHPDRENVARGARRQFHPRIYGILNGTCNYILTRMEQEKLSFADCLQEAQRLGYAEADPTFDVEGHDTAQKLAILASLAFGTKVEPERGLRRRHFVDRRPRTSNGADELGYRVKLLGVAVKTEQGIEQRVHPTMVPRTPRSRR